MKRYLCSTALAALLVATAARAEIGMGADVVNRYVWRGTDFGQAFSAQPYISYINGPLEVGAWSSWAVTGGGANENDIYISYSVGPVGLTLTDYFFPTGDENDFFNYADEDGIHILEISASYAAGPLSLMGAFNFLGDSEDSFYAEIGYDLGEIEEVGVSLTGGLGNGAYTTDTDPMLVNVAVNISRGDYFASYILNPDKESTFLVFGRSF